MSGYFSYIWHVCIPAFASCLMTLKKRTKTEQKNQQQQQQPPDNRTQLELWITLNMGRKCLSDLNRIPKSKEYWKHIILAALITTHTHTQSHSSLFFPPSAMLMRLMNDFDNNNLLHLYVSHVYCVFQTQAQHHPLSKIYHSKNRQIIISWCKPIRTNGSETTYSFRTI